MLLCLLGSGNRIVHEKKMIFFYTALLIHTVMALSY